MKRSSTATRVSVAAVTALLVLAAAARAQCVGDCDGNGAVTVAELIGGVNLVLENAPLSACPAFDPDGDGSVSVNEVIIPVGYALDSCPPPVTPTATPGKVSVFNGQ